MACLGEDPARRRAIAATHQDARQLPRRQQLVQARALLARPHDRLLRDSAGPPLHRPGDPRPARAAATARERQTSPCAPRRAPGPDRWSRALHRRHLSPAKHRRAAACHVGMCSSAPVVCQAWSPRCMRSMPAALPATRVAAQPPITSPTASQKIRRCSSAAREDFGGKPGAFGRRIQQVLGIGSDVMGEGEGQRILSRRAAASASSMKAWPRSKSPAMVCAKPA